MEKPIIAIPLGDAAGIGPELVAKLAAEGFFWQHCRPVLLGDARVLELGFRQCGKAAPYRCVEEVDSIDWSRELLPLLDSASLDPATIRVGEIDPRCGAECVAAIRRAVALYRQGKIHGLCYAPLSKAAMLAGGNPVNSEMELIALCLDHTGPFCEINMVDGVWTTRVTSHIPLMEVGRNLSVDAIVESGLLARQTLCSAGVLQPRIAFAALNPHCGENGLCGREEIEIIAPAVEKAREAGIDASGPYPSDVVFAKAFDGEFDGVVTMFHDQGQIALKLRGFGRGITIGGGFRLPVTTCGHGIAYDIAGQGVAGTGSFENAIATVGRMASSK